ncbi:MAG TPA: NUDIX hydrolase [Pseudomonadota bacterium]|nr:NUDIX hydrolase [Pseudomonadota bacterium]
MTPVQFVPRREIWFVSAFVNSAAMDAYARAKELATLLQAELQGLKAEQLPRLADRPELQARALAMAHSVQLRGSWNPYVDGFPYHDENTGLHFNKLGYFEFDVEYFAQTPERRSEIEPVLVQQPPVIAAERLRRLAAQKSSSTLRLDLISPIFVYVISEEVRPAPPPWTQEQIQAHKRAIGVWTEVYSGAWPDYNDELYDRRVAGNLSNRLSELHLIRKNSGLLYMAPENMSQFFDRYMRPFVVAPTAQLRAMHFALFSINESLDILLMRQAREDFSDRAVVEQKLRDLRQIRSALQMKMSGIYNELDSNKRQHYSSVLRHLLSEFSLDRGGIFLRINEKFEILHEGLQQLYQRKQAADQARTERRLGTLGTLFSLGVLSDFAALLLGTANSVKSHEVFASLVNGTFSTILLVVLLLAIAGRIRQRLKKTPPPVLAADAIIVDAQSRVLVITRRNPPFRGQRAFPGTLVQNGEPPTVALVREVKDETNLDIVIERQVGRYDATGRDPRGHIISAAYLCRLRGESQTLRCREDAGEAHFVSLEELRGEDLAFDHEDMLVDAERLLTGAAAG